MRAAVAAQIAALHKAVTRVQALIRGVQSRSRWSDVATARHVEAREGRKQAATTVQCAWRRASAVGEVTRRRADVTAAKRAAALEAALRGRVPQVLLCVTLLVIIDTMTRLPLMMHVQLNDAFGSDF
jgi:hypothetical protein